MPYISYYLSPLGKILLTADEKELTGLRFTDGKHVAQAFIKEHAEKNLPVFAQTKRWLDCYFSGQEPDFTPPFHFTGTDFQMEVWEILCTIPYGETTTYGAIAAQIAARHGIKRMSAQAVGGAVGHNPISVIVPCHRVVGKNGNLTGYAGGIDKKIKLLELENIDTRKFFLPKRKTIARLGGSEEKG